MRKSGESRICASHVVLLATALVCALYYGLVYSLPPLSETVTHTDSALDRGSVWASLDPRLVPLRPVQHVFFHLVAREVLSIEGARLVMVALHGAAAVTVFWLARALGSVGAAWWAWALFLLIPSAKTVVWIAAVGWPPMVLLCVTACLVAARPVRGGWLECWVLPPLALAALMTHQMAVLLPLSVLIVAAPRLSLPGFVECLTRRRGLAIALLFAALYAVYSLAVREGEVDGVNDLRAVPASTVRASFALAPSWVRVPAVDGLRGEFGWWGQIAGLGLLCLTLLGYGLFALSGDRQCRRVGLVALLWLAFPVVTAGFQQRYAYGAAPYAAIAVALWACGRPGVWRTAVLLLIVAVNAADSIRSINDYRAVGRVVRSCVRSVVDHARATSSAQIIVVGAPDELGPDHDLPVLGYGLRTTLIRAGLPESTRVLTLSRSWRSTDMQLTSEEELGRLADRGALVLVFDEGAGVYRELSR